MTIFNDAKDIKKLSVNENNPHNPVSAKKKKLGKMLNKNADNEFRVVFRSPLVG